MDDETIGLLTSAAAGVTAPLALATLRWFGLLLAAPVLRETAITWRMRLVLSAALAGLMLPALEPQHAEGRVQANSAVDTAVPSRLSTPAAVSAVASLSTEPELGGAGLLGSCLAELLLGISLGMGIRIVLAALSLAGGLIDHQAGLAMTQVFDPASSDETTVTGQALVWTVLAAMLLLEPVGGHLLIVAAMLDLFGVLPVATAGTTISLPVMLAELVRQSLVLALQVAAPILAVMSLVTLATGVLGRTAPHVQPLVIGLPARALVSLLVLALMISGTLEDVVQRLAGLTQHIAAVGG